MLRYLTNKVSPINPNPLDTPIGRKHSIDELRPFADFHDAGIISLLDLGGFFHKAFHPIPLYRTKVVNFHVVRQDICSF